jgi:hypothetical protein
MVLIPLIAKLISNLRALVTTWKMNGIGPHPKQPQNWMNVRSSLRGRVNRAALSALIDRRV